MLKIKNQIRGLYLSAVVGNLSLTGAWVAILAASCNFASGSGDALAYDSLKLLQREAYYEKYASNQLIIYRLCSGISTMCAGFALFSCVKSLKLRQRSIFYFR